MISHQYSSPQTPERVVLLGAHGFIGRAIRTKLEAQHIKTLALTSADIDLTQQGAADKLASRLSKSDVIVMLSALTPDKGRDIATLMKNLSMMQTVCAALEKTGCAQLIYFSSDAVYAMEASRVTEETPPSPGDLYGAMHYTREIMARSLKDTPVLVLRPTLVYGLDDTHNSYGPNRFRRSAGKDGAITLFGGGEEMRDHIHVDDVAAITERCILHRSSGTMNVATGVSTSFREVAERVAAQFDTPVKIVPTPRANPITYRHYDITHLIKAFPDIRFIALEDGIKRIHGQTVQTSSAMEGA